MRESSVERELYRLLLRRREVFERLHHEHAQFFESVSVKRIRQRTTKVFCGGLIDRIGEIPTARSRCPQPINRSATGEGDKPCHGRASFRIKASCLTPGFDVDILEQF